METVTIAYDGSMYTDHRAPPGPQEQQHGMMMVHDLLCPPPSSSPWQEDDEQAACSHSTMRVSVRIHDCDAHLPVVVVVVVVVVMGRPCLGEAVFGVCVKEGRDRP